MTPNTSILSGPDETEQTCIVNELLASASHAILTSNTDDQITASFAVFYDDSAVRDAWDKLKLFHTLPRRSQKKDKAEARVKDLSEIVIALRKIDWKDIQFHVSDLTQVCYVHGTIGDEIQLLNEVQQLKKRISVMEDLVKAQDSMSSKIDELLGLVSSSKTVAQTSYSNILKAIKPNHQPESDSNLQLGDNPTSIPPSTANQRPLFITKTINPFVKDPTDFRKFPQNFQHSTPTEVNNWKLVQRKKTKTKKRHVTGNCSNDDDDEETIKSSCVKQLRLFVTRCAENTTPEKLKSFLVKTRKFDVMSVEQLNARFSSYTSFNVTINRKDKSVSEFLKPELWPKDIMVRLFMLKRRGAGRNPALLSPSAVNLP
ncbi:unnamed protein product [Orchesella dallaii]|uniref:Uncharacterized protein n=1 Tax=Orchesella dallaii TaxID=48710 RepID=A0ABP1QRC0_9HEXA